MTPDRILVVDDEATTREICADSLRSAGYDVRVAESGGHAIECFESGGIDIVLTDLTMPDMTGLELLAYVRQNHCGVDVILMTADGTVATAVQALKLGAYDYITKPFNVDDLIHRVNRLAQSRELVTENQLMREHLNNSGSGGLIWTSAAMRQVYRMILKVAPRRQPVLILGESGTGKELVARAIHAHGPDPSGPFVPVDCGALSTNLIESELFGHVHGAFTGAGQRRLGLLASAGTGTVFLDEIGELQLDFQAKLLRAIQEHEFRALGSNQQERFEARIVAATNRDLATEVKEGRFRGDLYFRLNVLPIQVPPLRERKDDIPALVSHFIETARRPEDRAVGISRQALAALASYSWPGNVRELRNQIERALVSSDGPLIQARDLDPELAALATLGTCGCEDESKLTYLEQVERKAILDMLDAAGGHRLNAAKMLGISKTTLYKKLKEYGLEGCAAEST